MAFQYLDKDRDGFISPGDLKAVLGREKPMMHDYLYE
jgi:Ca2+-binding EF-hand superfamily protein